MKRVCDAICSCSSTRRQETELKEHTTQFAVVCWQECKKRKHKNITAASTQENGLQNNHCTRKRVPTVDHQSRHGNVGLAMASHSPARQRIAGSWASHLTYRRWSVASSPSHSIAPGCELSPFALCWTAHSHAPSQ